MYNATHDAKTGQNMTAISPALAAEFEKIKTFMATEVLPLEPLLLTQQWEKLNLALNELRKKVKHHNWWSTHFPTSMDSYSVHLTGLLAEVIGQSPLGHYVFGWQAPDIGNIELLHDHAPEHIKKQWLDPLKSGDIRSCFAMTEPNNAGSNPTLLSTSAKSEGDDWVIDGDKWFTTSADGAAFTIVMAVTEPDAPKHQRASMILVPMDTDGLIFKRNIPVMGHAGSGYFSHAELCFKSCRVPKSNTIGQAGHGFKLAQQRLGPGRIHHCMRWIGIAQRCFDIMCKHVKNRQITATQTLADQAMIQSKVATSFAAIQAARTMVLNTAQTVDAAGFDAARFEISMIKFHCAQMLQTVMDNCLQSLGALGMTDDSIVAFFFREERAARIYDGPDEVHMLSLGKQILKTY
ncbi:acyl-CoA dehydrogenase family protein [Marinicella rhabdoformis]|uniref:acyl-CoA dehydrogenase family protein n=1 Tax=Marinicella rhabdoformis TaxID=2580566 RepID=UPI001C554DB0|nr:acyl-CoA dehydrogenase family protein [Marinicella rhabdoformis]